MQVLKLTLLGCCLFLLSGVAFTSAEEKKEKAKKLQIGIKKRVDNCKTKSRKGDLLHMHYTVSNKRLKKNTF